MDTYTQSPQREGAKRFLACFGRIQYGKGGWIESPPLIYAWVGVSDGETGVKEYIEGNASKELDEPLSIFRMLNKAKTKQRLQHQLQLF